MKKERKTYEIVYIEADRMYGEAGYVVCVREMDVV